MCAHTLCLPPTPTHTCCVHESSSPERINTIDDGDTRSQERFYFGYLRFCYACRHYAAQRRAGGKVRRCCLSLHAARSSGVRPLVCAQNGRIDLNISGIPYARPTACGNMCDGVTVSALTSLAPAASTSRLAFVSGPCMFSSMSRNSCSWRMHTGVIRMQFPHTCSDRSMPLCRRPWVLRLSYAHCVHRSY